MRLPKVERQALYPFLALLITFLVSRAGYALAGIQFQGDTYLGYWQFIDPKLLQTDLWRSVFYLHSQPPLMNLLTGIMLQVFPDEHTAVFRSLFFLSGLVLMISIYQLGISMGFSHWLSAILSAWFMISPGTVLYENWLAYAHPLTTTLALAGAALYIFAGTHRLRWGVLFFSLLAVAALTWSLFHITWLLAILLMMVYVFQERRKVLLAALIPVILLAGWYAKNLVIVGEFTASSWAGMNLSKIATFRVPEKERRLLIKSGELSKFAQYPPFRNPQFYLKLLPDTPTTGIPLLDLPETSLGSRNHHHLVYVEASQYYLRDALRVIRLKPQYYLRSIGQAFYIFFHSSSDFDLILGNRGHIYGFDLWWNRLFFGQWLDDETSIDRNVSMSPLHAGWVIIVAFSVALISSPLFLWQNRKSLSDPQKLLVLFMSFNILYVTLVGNLMDIGENNRFRLVVDPFILMLFIYFSRMGIARLRKPPPLPVQKVSFSSTEGCE
jgi:hypothetical protein